MNMVYSNNKLYVDLEGVVSNNDILNVKNKIFNILNSYNIKEVILNTTTNINDELIGGVVKDYHKNYNGVIKVNYR